MNEQAEISFRKNFSEVVRLSKEKTTYEELKKKDPLLPRGWYEICQLALDVRVEFMQKYWLKTMPYHPRSHKVFTSFFDRLDDVDVFLLGEKKPPFFAQFVYSIKDKSSFFRGGIPLDMDQIYALNAQFGGTLPKDYLSFFHIHNGFAKSFDTGLIRAQDIVNHYKKIQTEIADSFLSQTLSRDSLIPFYECFGLHAYQCFFKDWHPGLSMGNIHFSSIEKSISRYSDPEATLAFESFSEWLAFYLEEI